MLPTWKGGGTASSNSNGSITSSVSANTDAGFSVVSYTGNGGSSATVGHGLTQAPDCIWLKHRTAGEGWVSFWNTPAINPTKFLGFNSTGVKQPLVENGIILHPQILYSQLEIKVE